MRAQKIPGLESETWGARPFFETFSFAGFASAFHAEPSEK